MMVWHLCRATAAPPWRQDFLKTRLRCSRSPRPLSVRQAHALLSWPEGRLQADNMTEAPQLIEANRDVLVLLLVSYTLGRALNKLDILALESLPNAQVVQIERGCEWGSLG